ncbi:MAG: hypothetical protein ACTHMC_26075 [Pseudobacter sp.]|uniref:hypothetical protein n=1 Tax=Pseudobacter sp. TaxID=2045420 RepID=UPI003F810DB7
MRHIILFLVICTLGCGSPPSIPETPPKTDSVIEKKISGRRLDSLKWLYYALHFRGDALFYDSAFHKDVMIKTVNCKVELMSHSHINQDTSFYYFTFADSGKIFKYVKGAFNVKGIGIYKEQYYPLSRQVIFNYQKNSDSTAAFIKKIDSNFRNYLKNYKYDITPWLKSEAVRRKIITSPTPSSS